MRAAHATADYAPYSEYDAAEEQRLLLAHAALVKRAVNQLGSLVGAALDREDMYQIGLLALLDALRRYGTPDERFAGYAAARVRGAILDELRRQDWRPRALRRESHRIRDAVRELVRTLGREPTQAEVQQMLGIDAETYREYQMAECAEQFASLDELLQECESPETGGGGSPEARLVVERSIAQALEQLSERERTVVQLYYEFDLSLKEIAAVLDLSEARVCQINKAALGKLRRLLQ